MSPIWTRNARNSIEIERKLELTIKFIKNQEISSVHETAHLFEMSCTTLQNRLNDKSVRMNLHTNSTKLSQTEENKIVE